MMDYSDNSASEYLVPYHDAPETEFRPEGAAVVYAVLGVLIIVGSLFIGNSYYVSAVVLFLSLFLAPFSRRSLRPLIYVTSILAANPVNWSAAFPGNLVVAFSLILLNIGLLFRVPRWVYLPLVLSLFAFLISSPGWLSDEPLLNIAQQGNYLLNFLFLPILVLPAVYCRMREGTDHGAKLRGLLYFLVIPSLSILLVAYKFGTPIRNVRPHSMVKMYQLVNTEVNFTRTHAGFIFASLICVSAAIVICRVKPFYRLVAVGCLVLSSLMLLIIGSVGSSLACLCGIGVMYLCVTRRVSITRAVVSLAVIAALLGGVWAATPDKVRTYVEQRFNERFVAQGVNTADRTVLWQRALDYSLEHPGGVGWSLSYGDRGKANAHNDYLLYAINFGILAGFVYLYMILRMWWFFLRQMKRVSKEPSVLAINLAGLGVSTVLLVNSMSDHLAANKWYFSVIWSILWYAYFCSEPFSAVQEASVEEPCTEEATG